MSTGSKFQYIEKILKLASQYYVYKYIEGTSNYVALDIDKYDMHRQHRLVAITITLLIGKL